MFKTEISGVGLEDHVLGIVAGLILLAVIIIFYYFEKNKKNTKKQKSNKEVSETALIVALSFGITFTARYIFIWPIGGFNYSFFTASPILFTALAYRNSFRAAFIGTQAYFILTVIIFGLYLPPDPWGAIQYFVIVYFLSNSLLALPGLLWRQKVKNGSLKLFIISIIITTCLRVSVITMGVMMYFISYYTPSSNFWVKLGIAFSFETVIYLLDGILSVIFGIMIWRSNKKFLIGSKIKTSVLKK